MQMDSTVRTGPFTRLNRDSADITRSSLGRIQRPATTVFLPQLLASIPVMPGI